MAADVWTERVRAVKAVPLSVQDANKVVQKWHRHSRPVLGGLFAVGASVRGELVGVAIVGRPVARMLQDGVTCEVTRLCVVDGVSDLHVCSSLYGRCLRVARELGYRKVVTYTLASEGGASLRAAGFTRAAELAKRPTWDTPSRRRQQTVTTLFGEVTTRDAGPKVRWERMT